MRIRCTLLLIALLLSACSPLQGRPPEPPAPDSGYVTIRVAFTEGYHTGPWLDVLILAFQEQHPGYRVEKVPLRYDARGEWDLLIQRGDIDVAPIFMPPEHTAKRFIDLTPHIRKGGLNLDGYNLPASHFFWEGGIYQLPFSVSPFALIGNAALFEAAGIPLPERGWTWDEFREVARRLTRGEGEQKTWGLSGGSAEFMLRMWLNQTRAKPVTGAELGPALQLFSTMVHTDKSIPKPPSLAYGQWFWEPDQAFQAGRAAMTIDLVESFAAPRPDGLRWVHLPVPALPGARPVLTVNPYSLGIPRASSQTEAAWEFIRFAAGPEGAQILAAAGVLPGYMTAEIAETWIKTQPPGARAMIEAEWGDTLGFNSGASADEQRRDLDFMFAVNQALSGKLGWEQAVTDFEAASQ